MRCYCVLHHGQPLQLVEQPDPVPTGTQVVVKVGAAGLCHTDLHLWEGYYDLGGGKKLQLADRGIKPPMTLSHEIVGEVWKSGPDAKDVPTGKTVVVHPWIGCGECNNCKRGEENICIKPQALGVARPGGFADYVVVPHAKYLVDIGDINAAVNIMVPFKFRNAGQVCISPTRFYVQDGVYQRFVDAFVAKTLTLKVGDGLTVGTTMGPLAQARRVPAVAGFVDDAKARGAKLLTGGSRLDSKGSFFAPTVLADLPDDSRLMTDEPFGPVAGMVRFKSLDEALQRANALPYGLAGYAFTQNTRAALAIQNGLEVGMLSINHMGLTFAETPFGGIKDSGMGSEGGAETFDGYLNTKFVSQLG